MKKREIRPEITLEKLGLNPFVASLLIPAYVVEGKLKAGDDGVWMPEEVEIEGEPYAKMFVSADKRLVTAGLGYRALQIWVWVLHTVKSGEDYIWINRTRAMAEMGIKTEKTFEAAIKELCRYGFLSKCVSIRGVYFLNPAMGWRGSRAKKWPERVVVKNTLEE